MTTFKFEYLGQQSDFDYMEGRFMRGGERNVIVTISTKGNDDEHDMACNLFVDKMVQMGWDKWSGFGGEGWGELEVSSYWHPVVDKEHALMVKADYKLVKSEVLTEIRNMK